ncbi:hypothetical protein NG895_24135, partial [Aeoliella sp. ICT_H6.2]|nr:hypothetical protein [Aeoliella straminimaris]
ATKSGTKFHDVDASGTWEPNGADGMASTPDDEIGLEGWQVRVYADDGDEVLSLAESAAVPVATVITDGNGDYSVQLEPGHYIVVEVLQPDWSQTAPNEEVNLVDSTLSQYGYAITLTSGQIDSGNNFGNLLANAEGLTPGFWKSNAANAERRPDKFADGNGVPLAWVATGVVPSDPLSSVGFTEFQVLNGNDTTFEEALNAKGGMEYALMRHAAAAYLNAAHPEVSYPLTTTQIVDMVNAVLAEADPSEINALKNVLDEYNNGGGGLNQFGVPSEDLEAARITKSRVVGAETQSTSSTSSLEQSEPLVAASLLSTSSTSESDSEGLLSPEAVDASSPDTSGGLLLLLETAEADDTEGSSSSDWVDAESEEDGTDASEAAVDEAFAVL